MTLNTLFQKREGGEKKKRKAESRGSEVDLQFEMLHPIPLQLLLLPSKFPRKLKHQMLHKIVIGFPQKSHSDFH